VKYWRRPLDAEKVVVPHGRLSIIVERCKGCSFCVEYCPRDVLAISDTFNEKGYHPPYALHAENCVACGLCELICPEFAIHMQQEAEAVK
jgi:2-oxoglutarate ferredoxin oxidoreductase subunit delta